MTYFDYTSNTISLDDLKTRAANLAERHKYGQPEADADQDVWDEWKELEKLNELIDDLHWTSDGTTLVNRSYWQDYCRETCYDLGDLGRDSFLESFIDWEKVADAMEQDWKDVTMPDGSEFLIRG